MRDDGGRFIKGLVPWNKGKTGKESHSYRERNGNWSGGSKRTMANYVLTRDDYVCQVCGHREPEIMEVDHIKPKSVYPEFALDMNNLVTLCPNCHRRKTNRERQSIVDMKKRMNSEEVQNG